MNACKFLQVMTFAKIRYGLSKRKIMISSSGKETKMNVFIFLNAIGSSKSPTE